MEALKKLCILNGNALKILACVFMLIDHTGMLLFPSELWLRYLGRLSMPIFAFMVAEGCRYTKNKWKHFFLLFGFGAVISGVCQLFSDFLVYDKPYLCIFVTFSLSTLIIYAMQHAKKSIFSDETKNTEKILSVGLVLALVALSYLLCQFTIVDYGFWGVMMPVFASLFDFHRIPAPDNLKQLDCLPIKLLSMAVAEIMLIFQHDFPSIQAHMLFAFFLLFLYNGKKGKARLKYFFYLFYPLHIAILSLLAVVYYFFP